MGAELATKPVQKQDRKSTHEGHAPGLESSRNTAGAASGMPRFLSSTTARIQRKALEIVPSTDPLEREADAVADRIMRSPAGSPVATSCSCGTSGDMCEECQQKQPAIRRHGSSSATPEHVPGIVGDVLHSPGRPLDSSTRAFFEPRFDRDLSQVRIHTDSSAADSARSIRAVAYSSGSHLVFDQGQYAPQSQSGQHLLAHELTHVVQQEGSSVQRLLRQPNPSAPDQQGAQPNATVETIQAEKISGEEYKQLTGLPADTLPEGVLVRDLDQLSDTMRKAPADTLPPGVGPIDESSMRHDSQAAAAGAVFGPSPLSLVPANATGIHWVGGHFSVFSKVNGKVTIRGFRADLLTHLGEILPHFGERFSERLSLGVEGHIYNDLLFTRWVPGNQTVIYVPTDEETAAAFQEELEGAVYDATYRHSTPNPNAKPGSTERRMADFLKEKTGEPTAVVCSDNCTTEPVRELIDSAIGMHPQVGEPGSRIDIVTGQMENGGVDPYSAGKASLTREFMANPDLTLAKAGAARIGMTGKYSTAALGVVRIGGTIWMVWGGIETVEALYDAWGEGHFAEVLAHEGATWGGGIGGGELVDAIASDYAENVLLIGASDVSASFLLGTAGIAFFVGWLGARVLSGAVETAINFFPAMFDAARQVAGIVKDVSEATKSFNSQITNLVFFRPTIVHRYQVDPSNWDLRDMPAATANAARYLGNAAWHTLGPLQFEDFSAGALETFAQLGLDPNVAAILSPSLGTVDAPLAPEKLLAMTPVDLVELLEARRSLHFAREPEWLADDMLKPEGQKIDEMSLNVRVAPLVARRASINPNNWDLSLAGEGGKNILAAGVNIWQQLRALRMEEFDAKSELPLAKLGLSPTVAFELAQILDRPLGDNFKPVSEEVPQQYLGEYANSLLSGTPEDFVNLLTSTGNLRYRQDPATIASASLQWLRAGYQPW